MGRDWNHRRVDRPHDPLQIVIEEARRAGLPNSAGSDNLAIMMSDKESPDAEDAARTDEQGRSRPLVFISHDTRDAELAEAFGKLLSSVSAGMLKAFRSSDRKAGQGIDFGAEWYPELMKQIDSACDVVCLLTEHSLGRPWILYEAGVAKGKLDVPVHGLALGVPLSKASAGPFAQFQNCNNDADSITKLVIQLVQRLPNADPDRETVKAQVDVFRERVEGILAQAATVDDDELEHDEASTAKLFEEIKVMFQDLPSRIDGVAERAREPRSMRALSPGMLHDMAEAIGHGEPNPGIVALMCASYVRDELPWLYEMAVELYRQSLTAEPVAISRSYRKLRGGSRDSHDGPLVTRHTIKADNDAAGRVADAYAPLRDARRATSEWRLIELRARRDENGLEGTKLDSAPMWRRIIDLHAQRFDVSTADARTCVTLGATAYAARGTQPDGVRTPPPASRPDSPRSAKRGGIARDVRLEERARSGSADGSAAGLDILNILCPPHPIHASLSEPFSPDIRSRRLLASSDAKQERFVGGRSVTTAFIKGSHDTTRRSFASTVAPPRMTRRHCPSST